MYGATVAVVVYNGQVGGTVRTSEKGTLVKGGNGVIAVPESLGKPGMGIGSGTRIPAETQHLNNSLRIES